MKPKIDSTLLFKKGRPKGLQVSRKAGLQLTFHGVFLNPSLALSSSLALVLFGCQKDPGSLTASVRSTKKVHSASGAKPFQPETFNSPAASQSIQMGALDVFKSGQTRSANSAEIWALAQCACLSSASIKVLTLQSQVKGALPQFLVPTIRKEILGNSMLKAVEGISGGIGQLLGTNALQGLTQGLVTAEKIESEIKKGLVEKVAQVLGGAQSLEAQSQLRMDLFPDMPSLEQGTQKQAPSTALKTISLAPAAARWRLVADHTELWQASATRINTHASVQFLELMRVLLEWQYIYGLDTNPDGQTSGGLTLSTQGTDLMLRPFDPRTATTNRFSAGVFSMTLIEKPLLEMVQKGPGQVWSWTQAPIETMDLAHIWHAAARTYARLRPAGRTAISQAFASTGSATVQPTKIGGSVGRAGSSGSGIFPADTHKLALAFLPGMADLLNGPIIDESKRLLRRCARVPGWPASALCVQQDEPATPATLAALLQALHHWVSALQDTADDSLSSESAAKLKDAPAQLLKAMQFVAQIILQNHVGTQDDSGAVDSLALWVSKEGRNQAEMLQAAKILTALIEAEQVHLKSLFLRQRIDALMGWYLGTFLEPYWLGQRSADAKSAEIFFWNFSLLKTYARNFKDAGQTPQWLTNALRFLEDTVKQWERKQTP